jgi:hypothetical protein
MVRHVLARQAGARELALQPASQDRYRLVGYVEDASQADAIEAALQRHGIGFDARWTAVDGLRQALAERVALPAGQPASALRYEGRGIFALTAAGASAQRVDELARAAMTALPAVQGLVVELTPQATDPEAGELRPRRWQYRREGDLLRVNGNVPPSAGGWHGAVREVRREALPSIVLEDGARYFEGATLPGGAVLDAITEHRLLLRVDGGLQELILPGASTAPQPGQGAPRPSG